MVIMRPSFLIVVLLSSLLSGALSAAEKAAPAASSKSEAWTGTITFTRTQSNSTNKTVDRVSQRGKDTQSWEMNYDYKATVGVVEDPARPDASQGKASISHSFTSKETVVAVERNSCDRGKTWQEMTGTFVNQTNIRGQGKAEADVHVGMNDDGTYTVSVGVPEIYGQLTGSESSTFSGQCSPKEGKNRSIPATQTSIQGHSLTSDGSHRTDPKSPNKISGSFSLKIPGGVVETITWSLQRNVTPLRITDLKFEDMKYPKWNDWQEITEQIGTTDGNWVKIKAKVFNGSGSSKSGEVVFKETYKGDKWDGAKPDAALEEQKISVSLEPGEERDVELVWNSSGYAWYDDGRPRLVQRIKAELMEKATKVDEMTKNLKVAPRPLVMIAGIWTETHAFEVYQNILTTSHSYDWKAFSARDVSYYGTINQEGTVNQAASVGSVYDKADGLAKYVDAVRKDRNAWHVDMMGHGTGGLVGRLLVHKQEMVPDGQPIVKNLLLLGTPNNGINCADIIADVLANEATKPMAKQLSSDEMATFNKSVTQYRGTKVSTLAGELIPGLCGPTQFGDGLVTLESAKFGIGDVTICKSLHGDLLNTANFSDYVKPHLATGPKGTYPLLKK